MPQRYAVEMHDEFVLKGNTAVLKCHVPGFVKDYVIVEAWDKGAHGESRCHVEINHVIKSSEQTAAYFYGPPKLEAQKKTSSKPKFC
ncbi:hypothetical protein CEXT_127841 [Caerostris extrusa]|uniref:Uncharacterized protein n=1 Tax=Caerostris extrusa TaxID=172846 RepID=A0AAV4SUB6_CAEEX|nr:hypothetical protein CEXT_127841 [Caerostris extrusa]